MVLDFDKTADKVATRVKAAGGSEKLTAQQLKDIRADMLQVMPEAMKQLKALRTPTKDRRALDLTLAQFVKEKFGIAPDDRGTADPFFHCLGINPGHATVQQLMTMPDFDEGHRWLIPEVFREAVRLGLRKNPIYPQLIAAEESVTQPQVFMPYINMSDAMPHKIGEAETIPVGSMSFGQKSVKLQKVGIGLKITDEVRDYVPLNVLSVYLQDVGVKINTALDATAISVLTNGDGNANGAPTIGAGTVYNAAAPTTTGLLYHDLLRAWLRMGQLGRMPQIILAGEDIALKILTLPEYTNAQTLLAGIETKNATLRTPIPSTQSIYVHGAVANNQAMLVDTTSALIKLNSQPLTVESDRIVERQISGTYVSLTTGFGKLFTDAAVSIDHTLAYTSYPFPSYMDVAAAQKQVFSS